MPYGVNPYGAVPSALKELRLSFTDVLNNIIQGREVERQTARDLAAVELAKAKVEADTQRFAIEQTGRQQERELTGLWKGREYGLERDKMEEQARKNLQDALYQQGMLGVQEKQVGVAERQATVAERKQTSEEKKLKEIDIPESQQKVENQKKLLEKLGWDLQETKERVKQLKDDNRTDTIANFAKRALIPPHILNYLVGPEAQGNVTTGKEFTKWLSNNKVLLDSPDASGALEQHTIFKRIEDINTSLKTMPVNDPARATLIAQKATLGKRHEEIDTLRQILRAKPEQIAAIASKVYNTSMELQEQWKDKGGEAAYVQNYYDTIKKMKTSDDKIINMLKDNPVPGEPAKPEPAKGGVPSAKPQSSKTGLTPKGREFIELYKQQLKAIREESEKGTVSPTQKPEAKILDKATATKILQEAGGDKEKARNLAVKRGYTF